MATSKAMKGWEKKYAAQIKGLAEANKVDLGVASSMLQSNLTGGCQNKGGGTISSVQAALWDILKVQTWKKQNPFLQ